MMTDLQIRPEKGLIHRGNISAIRKVMEKALKGEEILTAFLGGSITQGSLSSSPETCYAYLVYQWWVKRFPEAKVTFLNAGIGGTTSQFGVARVRDHVLSKKPDFLLTEFAVNDENNEFFRETYEGLVRVILSDPDAPALLLMNNVMYDTGKSAEEMHLQIAEHYDLPMVSMKESIYPEVVSGKIKASRITPDNLHPNDEGHALVASVITDLLDKICETVGGSDDDRTVIKLPEPLTENGYQYSLRIKNRNADREGITVIPNGFLPDTHEKKEFLDIYSGGYTASKVGDTITFRACCTGLAIQYRKTVNRPAPVATAVIDDDEAHPVMLDANFEEDWGDCLYIETVARHLPYGEHRVKITVTETHEDDRVPFYLVSVIASR